MTAFALLGLIHSQYPAEMVGATAGQMFISGIGWPIKFTNAKINVQF